MQRLLFSHFKHPKHYRFFVFLPSFKKNKVFGLSFVSLESQGKQRQSPELRDALSKEQKIKIKK